MLATFLCAAIVLIFIISKPEDMLHWFLLPITLCGVIIAIDAVDWLRGRMDLMDPVGWVGLFGLHFFLIAPLLIVLWDYQMPYLPTLEDWRPWLGRMGVLNTVGLALYRISRGWIKLNFTKQHQQIRVIDPPLMRIVLYFALAITAALQLLVLVQTGGIGGYVEAFEQGSFEGMGVLFAFSESFPFLLLIGIVGFAGSGENRRAWWFILIALMLFFVIRLIFFGGLRGSRSNTVFAMIWAIGVIHLWVRPIPRRFLVVAAIAGILFMYLMGFFKVLGADFVQVLLNPSQLTFFEQETNRTFRGALIGDLSRADVQAYMLYNLIERWPDFPYAWGRTYPAGILVIVPSAIWPGKPATKVVEGTEAMIGPGNYVPGVWVASNVYGLMGEAFLNFGVYLAPLSFITLGLLVGLVRRWYYALHAKDVFRLWIPFLVIFCVTYAVNDSDNNSVSLVIRPLAPLIVLWLGSRQFHLNQLDKTSHEDRN